MDGAPFVPSLRKMTALAAVHFAADAEMSTSGCICNLPQRMLRLEENYPRILVDYLGEEAAMYVFASAYADHLPYAQLTRDDIRCLLSNREFWVNIQRSFLDLAWVRNEMARTAQFYLEGIEGKRLIFPCTMGSESFWGSTIYKIQLDHRCCCLFDILCCSEMLPSIFIKSHCGVCKTERGPLLDAVIEDHFVAGADWFLKYDLFLHSVHRESCLPMIYILIFNCYHDITLCCHLFL